MIKLFRGNKKNLIKFFSTEIKKVEKPTDNDGPKVETVGNEKVKVKISRPEEDETFKEKPKEEPITIAGTTQGVGYLDQISLFLSGLFLGYLAYLYIKRKIRKQFQGIYEDVYEIQDTMTFEQNELINFLNEEKKLIDLKHQREYAKKFHAPSFTFEEYTMLNFKRYWNDVLWTIGQTISRSNERRIQREEEKLQQRISDEIKSLGYDLKNVEVKKVTKI